MAKQKEIVTISDITKFGDSLAKSIRANLRSVTPKLGGSGMVKLSNAQSRAGKTSISIVIGEGKKDPKSPTPTNYRNGPGRHGLERRQPLHHGPRADDRPGHSATVRLGPFAAIRSRSSSTAWRRRCSSATSIWPTPRKGCRRRATAETSAIRRRLSIERPTTRRRRSSARRSDSVVRLYVETNGVAGLQSRESGVGQSRPVHRTHVAVPLDGSNQFPAGNWEITSQIDLNNPTLGLHRGRGAIDLRHGRGPGGNITSDAAADRLGDLPRHARTAGYATSTSTSRNNPYDICDPKASTATAPRRWSTRW